MCFDRYYDPASNANCLPCHYSCEVCHGGTATNCRVCSSIAKRTFNAATSKCLCQSGYYDDGANELCLACNAACLLCTNSLTTSCTSCNSTNYLFLSRTTCFVTCPDNYFGNPLTMTCDACSANCVHCTDANTCTSCITNIYLYSGVCYNVCPRGSYSNFPVYTCTTCPKGCSDCINGTNCSACYDRYYFDTLLKLCFACNSLCFNCLGPGQNQCTSCVSPLYYNNNQCYNMTCPYGQFVDPIKGCGNCNDKFSNSLTCDFNKALICVSPYLLISGQCVSCTSVTGYMISTTGTCVEICGDGILIMFQCDDGNRLNGDGCSSNCVIESGWSCTPTSPSICQLFQPITMSLTSLAKVPGKNSLNIVLGLSLPILLKQTLTLTVEGATKYNYTVKQGS